MNISKHRNWWEPCYIQVIKLFLWCTRLLCMPVDQLFACAHGCERPIIKRYIAAYTGKGRDICLSIDEHFWRCEFWNVPHLSFDGCLRQKYVSKLVPAHMAVYDCFLISVWYLDDLWFIRHLPGLISRIKTVIVICSLARNSWQQRNPVLPAKMRHHEHWLRQLRNCDNCLKPRGISNVLDDIMLL